MLMDETNCECFGGSGMRGTTTTLAISGLSFLLTLIWGQPFLYLLRRLKIGKLMGIIE